MHNIIIYNKINNIIVHAGVFFMDQVQILKIEIDNDKN